MLTKNQISKLIVEKEYDGPDVEQNLRKILERIRKFAPEFPNQFVLAAKDGEPAVGYWFETDAETEAELMERIASCTREWAGGEKVRFCTFTGFQRI